MTVIAWHTRTSRGNRVEIPLGDYPSADLANLDGACAEALILSLLAGLDDMAALTRINRATLRAMMDASHGQRDPGDEDDGIVGGEGSA